MPVLGHWLPCASATMVGSMPHADRAAVMELIFSNIRDIPFWPQLSPYPSESMMEQYLEGLPGLERKDGRVFVNTEGDFFEKELYEFYEECLRIADNPALIKESSRFGLGPETGRTFRFFVETLKKNLPVSAVKGQVVGPFTLLSGLKDQRGKLILYDNRMVDVVMRHLAMKGLWQFYQLRDLCDRVIMFYDEPALAGFGSSAFISVSGTFIAQLINDMLSLLKPAGVLVGIHVCANTDWSILLNCPVDIVNFDAYNYGEKFLIYEGQITSFLERGGLVAWGVVPTDNEEKVFAETPEALFKRALELFRRLSSMDRWVAERAIITPSCGCGTLSKGAAERVVGLLSETSSCIRDYFGF